MLLQSQTDDPEMLVVNVLQFVALLASFTSIKDKNRIAVNETEALICALV